MTMQTIDRLKINANHENKEVRIQKTLTDMSKPKKMELKNGGKVEVHTPFTTRSKELQQLYNGKSTNHAAQYQHACRPLCKLELLVFGPGE